MEGDILRQTTRKNYWVMAMHSDSVVPRYRAILSPPLHTTNTPKLGFLWFFISFAFFLWFHFFLTGYLQFFFFYWLCVGFLCSLSGFLVFLSLLYFGFLLFLFWFLCFFAFLFVSLSVFIRLLFFQHMSAFFSVHNVHLKSIGGFLLWYLIRLQHIYNFWLLHAILSTVLGNIGLYYPLLYYFWD